ncbi:MAG TPA: hypothetical protein VNX68_11055 [Nitrosopumilaceae archaeon]|jgi:hypothetical protein|nr:hypothetical protein [Nitrosopumilaceae archaeon]
MNSVVVSVGKNLVLVGLLALSLISRYLGWFSGHDLIMIQLAIGAFYIFLSYYEINSAWFKAQLPKERFAYYPGSFYMSIAIKTGVYVMFAFVLMFSGSVMKYLYPVCLIIAFTKIVVCILVIVKRLCFVSIYANYILIAREKLDRIFAGEIENVEFRHDIIYLVKKDRSTYTIKTFSIEHKKEFIAQMRDWIINNNLTITSESLSKLQESLI